MTALMAAVRCRGLQHLPESPHLPALAPLLPTLPLAHAR